LFVHIVEISHGTKQALWCCYAVQEMLKPLVEIALQISELRELTGRNEPNVIT